MPIKKTTKLDSKVVKSSEQKVVKSEDKKSSTKKVVVKRRKVDLVPTKASAVAIVSQANRAKKQALIEKMESWNSIPRNIASWDDTKIPLWVWIFFGCSLLLFCISFYQAVFRPAIDRDIIASNENSDIYMISWNGSESDGATLQEESYLVEEWNKEEINQNCEREVLDWSSNVVINTIQEYFDFLSNRQFEEASDLLIPALRNSSEIRDHFTSLRLNPFLDWIEWWKLVPMNFNYVSTSTFGRDRYSFDLSYVLKSNQEKYDETREMVVDTKWDEPKITNIVCVTSKCSYHPIFWPENFGLK